MFAHGDHGLGTSSAGERGGEGSYRSNPRMKDRVCAMRIRRWRFVFVCGAIVEVGRHLKLNHFYFWKLIFTKHHNLYKAAMFRPQSLSRLVEEAVQSPSVCRVRASICYRCSISSFNPSYPHSASVPVCLPKHRS